MIGTTLEWALNEHGLTLPHYPASANCATLGGYLAARGSGVISTKYGKAEDLVLAIQAVLPDGTIFRTPPVPSHATGPMLMNLFLGSEGTMGVITEATFLPLPETAEGTVAASAIGVVRDSLDRVDAVAIGPGVTTNDETSEFVRTLVRETDSPIALDADGLNAFAGRAHELADRSGDLVLTPHDGEFVRLAGGTVDELKDDRVGRVRKFAAEIRATVLLKGNPSLAAIASGEVRLNPTGGPALSTAGTGDVLTGIVASLLARRCSSMDAASAAAYVHGLAGDLAGFDLATGATAEDVLERVPAAVLELAG